MNEANDLSSQNQKLIAESKRLRLRLQHALEELEEACEQAERQRYEACRRRISINHPLRGHRTRE